MDCEKCLSKCKAGCCGVVPFTMKQIIQNPPPADKKIQTIRAGEKDGVAYYILQTDDLTCPYLSEEKRCTIYENRPEVCKMFGDETHPLLTCPYQDKNGRLRSRQEKRACDRKINDDFNKNITKKNMCYDNDVERDVAEAEEEEKEEVK
jgi:Fe-S-cluster containining protein